MQLTTREAYGAELAPWVDALAEIRIEVFREYPYLYDGSVDYERGYLRTYVDSPRSMAVLVFEGDRLVGASTCLPLEDEEEAFQRPFRDAGIPVRTVCYLGESMLLAPYRGQGFGKLFFRRRERHARSLSGVREAAFCAVDRPAEDPRRPADYRPLDDFWRRQGYQRDASLRARFPWKEIGEDEETEKPLTFWRKALV